MLTVVSKQQVESIPVYSDPNSILVKASTLHIDSSIVTETITVKANLSPILVYDNTYIEPFTYIDGGFFDAAGTPVDALYYNTISWDVTWNGGRPQFDLPVKICYPRCMKECSHKWYMREAGITCIVCGEVWEKDETEDQRVIVLYN